MNPKRDRTCPLCYAITPEQYFDEHIRDFHRVTAPEAKAYILENATISTVEVPTMEDFLQGTQGMR